MLTLAFIVGRKPDAVNFWIGDERAVTSSEYSSHVYVICALLIAQILPPSLSPSPSTPLPQWCSEGIDAWVQKNHTPTP